MDKTETQKVINKYREELVVMTTEEIIVELFMAYDQATTNDGFPPRKELLMKFQAAKREIEKRLNQAEINAYDWYAIGEWAYQSEVVDTGSIDIIGEGEEYADKHEWIECWLDQFRLNK